MLWRSRSPILGRNPACWSWSEPSRPISLLRDDDFNLPQQSYNTSFRQVIARLGNCSGERLDKALNLHCDNMDRPTFERGRYRCSHSQWVLYRPQITVSAQKCALSYCSWQLAAARAALALPSRGSCVALPPTTRYLISRQRTLREHAQVGHSLNARRLCTKEPLECNSINTNHYILTDLH